MQIIFQDEFLVAINKPSGLLVHRSKIDKHETRFALQEVRDVLRQHVYPLHRLDKPTSGVLMFALNSDIARKMMHQFENGKIEKQYIAIVRGFTANEETIDYPLKEIQDKMTDSQANKNKPPQSAITYYKTLKKIELPIAVGRYTSSRYSYIEITPKTGRKHQIRRHMKHIFHPIVGDTTHGDGKHNKMFREEFDCYRLLLHAKKLSFVHPDTNKEVIVDAPVKGVFEQILQLPGWH